jgi:hypothetical protein
MLLSNANIFILHMASCPISDIFILHMTSCPNSELDWLLITIVTAAAAAAAAAAADCMRYIKKCFYLFAYRLRWVIGSDERARAFPLLLKAAAVARKRTSS